MFSLFRCYNNETLGVFKSFVQNTMKLLKRLHKHPGNVFENLDSIIRN